jgi:tetratricopeptide (TPR) repeat protein
MTPPAPSASELVSLLHADQLRRWQRGEPLPVEAYLQLHPTLAEQPERVIDLIYAELVLREEHGEEPQLDEYLQRFPAHTEALRRQLQLHRALQDSAPLAGLLPSGTSATLAVANALSRRASPGNGSAFPTIPGYEIESELGRGGMGVVYKARQLRPQRIVALKMIRAGAYADAHELARFRAEAEAVARLQHANVVQVYEVGEHQGLPYFSLEFCTGGSLAERLKGAPLQPPEAARLVEIVARAMQEAHQHHIIHRDLKPANVLLLEDGTPKVSDFGLAKKLDQAGGPTQTGAILGTPSYMAPEQARGRTQDVGPAADVYALGAVLYECLAGRPPFKAATSAETMMQVLTDDPVPVRQLQPKVPRDLETICLKCLQKQPGKRYATAEDLATDLGRFLAGEPVQARPIGAGERLIKWARRNRAVAGLLTTVMIALVLGATVASLLAVQANIARQQADANAQLILLEQQRTDAARQRIRQALDAMSSHVIDDWLGKQQELLPEQKRFLQQALAWYEELAGDTAADSASRSGAAGAHYRVGMIRWGLGQHQEAKAANGRAIELYEQLAADFPDEPEYRNRLAWCHRQQGRLLWLTGEPAQAEKAYNDALVIQTALAAQLPGNADYREEAATTYFYLGGLLQQTARLSAAEAAYEEALAVLEKLRDESPTKGDYRRELARGHIQRGDVRRILGKPKKAEEDLNAAAALLEELDRDFPNVATYREELACCYKSLGNLFRVTNRPKEAAERYRAAIATFQRLSAAYPTMPRYRHGLATGQHNLGELLRTSGAAKEAETAFQAALDVSRPLADAFPSVHSYRFLVASNLNGRGMAWHGGRELAKAEADYQAALDILRELTRALPDIAEYQRVQGQILNNLGALLAASNRPKEAEAAFREAVTAHEKLVTAEPGVPDHESELSSTLGNLATFFGNQEDWSSARPLLEQAVTRQRKAFQSNPRNPDYRKRLRSQLDKLGDVLVQLNDHEAAAAVAQEWSQAFPDDAAHAIDIAELLARCVPLAEADTRLPTTRRNELAQVYGAHAIGLLRQAIGRAENLEKVRTDHAFDPLRGREEFQQLLREVPAPRK